MLLLAVGLGGCGTVASDKSTSCQVFKPLSWSKKDTRITVRGIVGHNAAGKVLCGWKAK